MNLVYTEPRPSTSAASADVRTATATLEASMTRKGVVIQNHNTAPLYVYYGTGASGTVFTLILPACTAQDDGTSPAIEIRNWKGTISFYAAATYRYTATVL